jgi:hypothetical protein
MPTTKIAYKNLSIYHVRPGYVIKRKSVRKTFKYKSNIPPGCLNYPKLRQNAPNVEHLGKVFKSMENNPSQFSVVCAFRQIACAFHIFDDRAREWRHRGR